MQKNGRWERMEMLEDTLSYLSAKELANRWKVRVRTVQRKCKLGEFESINVGSDKRPHYRISSKYIIKQEESGKCLNIGYIREKLQSQRRGLLGGSMR